MDISDVYFAARKAYDKSPDQEQAKTWNAVLASQFTPAEVQEAVRQWQSNTRIDDYTGEPIGRRFPSTADIKLLCEQNRLPKKATSRSGSVCNNPECHSGFVLDRDQRYPGKDIMVAKVCEECKRIKSSEVA